MASTKIKIKGTLTGWIPSLIEPPTWKGEASDFRLKVRVEGNEAAELEDVLSSNYESLCDWYSMKSGKRTFFGEPWETDEEGITIRLCAKVKYEEFPLPVVDSELIPIAEDLALREGTEVVISAEFKAYSPKSPKGGMRIRPRAIKVIKAVTADAVDSGVNVRDEFDDIEEGFKQSKPNVKQKAANVATEDDDF